MKRELCKFLSGVVAGLAYVHAAYALALPRGIINQPVWRGRKWKLEYIWAEAATYSVISLALAYFGWFRKPQEELPEFSVDVIVDERSALAP